MVLSLPSFLSFLSFLFLLFSPLPFTYTVSNRIITVAILWSMHLPLKPQI